MRQWHGLMGNAIALGITHNQAWPAECQLPGLLSFSLCPSARLSLLPAQEFPREKELDAYVLRVQITVLDGAIIDIFMEHACRLRLHAWQAGSRKIANGEGGAKMRTLSRD